MSGRRASNPQPIAWKAIALPIELLPLVDFSGLDNPQRSQTKPTKIGWWREKDSNLRSRSNGFTVRPI